MRSHRAAVSGRPARRRLPLVRYAVAVGAVLVLGACSSGTAGDPSAGSDTGSGSITVTDTTGSVHLKKPASRVVALEWSYAEDLLTLGVTPVGVGDAGTYGDWVSGPKLPSGVTDVGSRAQPSLEKIKALHPDLIIAEKSRSTANLGQLKAIAPVLVFDAYSPNTKLVATANDHLRQIGTAVGKPGKAKRVIDDYDRAVADARQRIDAAGLAGTEVTLLQGFSVNGQPSIRAYTDHAQAVQVLTSIGLKNAWHGKDSDPSGFTGIGVEGLTRVSDSTVLYVAQDSDNPFTGALATNATWKNLGFVKGHRLHPLAADTWFWGGPASDEILVDRALKALDA